MELENKIQAAYKASKDYPELAKAFSEMGMRSYTVDVATGITLYRFDNGNNTLHSTYGPPRNIKMEFDKELTIKAVKDSQQGSISYPEFMDAIAKAGVRFYEATLQGENRRVTYIGSRGHYEESIPV